MPNGTSGPEPESPVISSGVWRGAAGSAQGFVSKFVKKKIPAHKYTANDSSGCTYRRRFSAAAMAVSLIVSAMAAAKVDCRDVRFVEMEEF